MTRRLIILPKAEQDVQAIFDYIRERSSDGADRWFRAFLDAATKVLSFPEAYSLAPEDEIVQREIRQFLFRTRSGNVYRGLFIVVSAEVIVLRVRSPGHPPLSQDELSAVH